MNVLRRISFSKLLVLCGATVAIGISAAAIALALDSGPTPPARPLAQAVHNALAGAKASRLSGFSASVKLTNHLVEGSELASGGDGAGGGLASSPLLTGATGRLWVGDGHLRLELQAEKGDTQILWDGHAFTVYDAASDTVYRYTPKQGEGGEESQTPSDEHGELPSVAKIEEAIAHIRRHAQLSEPSPTDVGGRPAYTVRLSPQESGSLIGGTELSFDADNAVPLRAAVYSSTTSTPVIEIAAGEVSYGPVDPSVFQITPPKSAKVEELSLHEGSAKYGKPDAAKPKLSTHGHGITSIEVLEAKQKGGSSSSGLEGLPQVKVGGATASELRTELGTLLTFERGGTRYVLAGAVDPAAVEALARGL